MPFKGVYNNSIADLPFDIDQYSELDHISKGESLKQAVRILAEEKKRRHKRTLKLAVLMPTVLAPFGFAPAVLTVSLGINENKESFFSVQRLGTISNLTEYLLT